MVVPSAKFQVVCATLAPNATCPSQIGPSPKLKPFTYIGRSTTIGTVGERTWVETPRVPGPMPQLTATPPLIPQPAVAGVGLPLNTCTVVRLLGGSVKVRLGCAPESVK